MDFEAAAAELVLLPRSKLLPLAQPEQALADAAGLLGRQAVHAAPAEPELGSLQKSHGQTAPS